MSLWIQFRENDLKRFALICVMALAVAASALFTVNFTPPTYAYALNDVLSVAFTPPNISAEVVLAVAALVAVVLVFDIVMSAATRGREQNRTYGRIDNNRAKSNAGDGGRTVYRISAVLVLMLATISAMQRRARDLGHILVGHGKGDYIPLTPNPA